MMVTALADHLWQSTLFALVAWLFTLALQNNNARVRYWVWMAASLKFLIPFALLTALGGQFSLRSAPSASITQSFIDAVQQVVEPLATPALVMRASQASNVDWSVIAIVLWATGCSALIARWSVSWVRVRSAVRKGVVTSIEATLVVKSTPVLSEPGVVGIVRPVLLIPDGIATRLTATQLQAILAHELCHVRRRDNLTAAIHMLVEALFWFHPLVWWIGARLVDERERACDEGVVELGNEPQAYAEGILKVCQFYMESKLTCVAGVSGANLKHRVESIMSNRMIDSLNATKKMLLVSVAALAITGPLVFGVLTTQTAGAQTAANGSQVFDAVSIHSAVPAESKEKEAHWLFMKDGNFSMKDQSLRYLILFAYDLHGTQLVGGPAWLDSTRFDIEASKSNVVPDAVRNDNFLLYRRMVQTLLADRFAIRLHDETQPIAAYVLSRGNEEPAFAKVAPVQLPSFVKVGSSVTPDRSGITFREAPIQYLVGLLSSQLQRPVIDQTKLTGKYNFRLDKPFDAETLPAVVEQQLGLKLEAQVLPLKVVVIDGVQYPTLDSVSAPPPAVAAGLVMDIVPADQIVFASFRKEFDWRLPNQSIRDMIIGSYHVQAKQIIGGPQWIDSMRYHIAVGGAGFKPVGMEQMRQTAELNRTLLIDRFGLKFHREVRRVPVYVLALSEQGINAAGLKAELPEETGLPIKMNIDGLAANSPIMKSTPMSAFAWQLSVQMNSIVLDRTGLKGTYTVQLQGEPNATTLPELVRMQLGLTLEARNEPTEVFVIDSIEPYRG